MQMNHIKEFFKNSTVLITGGTGSWGHELVTQLLRYTDVKEIRIFSRNEHKQVAMKQEFNNETLKFIIGDVRSMASLNHAMINVDYVFHLAALKHVPVCEFNTWEAVLTNVNGTQNVIESAILNGVKKVIDISTDKAVEPFNFYGVTKACGEKLIINANNNYESKTKFLCIRGGNVMGTNGSVLPLFKKQILENNTVTITNPQMTRFLMSTHEAIRLVLEAVTVSIGGEIFVMRMSATTVIVMAKAMIKLFGNSKTKIKKIDERPGEKMDEVLISKNEVHYAREFSREYYVILPQINTKSNFKNYENMPKSTLAEFTSTSATQLSVDQLVAILKTESWVGKKFY